MTERPNTSRDDFKHFFDKPAVVQLIQPMVECADSGRSIDEQAVPVGKARGNEVTVALVLSGVLSPTGEGMLLLQWSDDGGSQFETMVRPDQIAHVTIIAKANRSRLVLPQKDKLQV